MILALLVKTLRVRAVAPIQALQIWNHIYNIRSIVVVNDLSCWNNDRE
jgi:hypothetical protein